MTTKNNAFMCLAATALSLTTLLGCGNGSSDGASTNPPADAGGSAGSAGGAGGAAGGAGGSAGSAAGTAGSAGASVDPKDICPGACQTMVTCNASTDVAACEAQCVKELMGTGYLIPEIAIDFFTTVRDAKEDKNCAFVYGQRYWHKWDLDQPPQNKFDKLAEQSVLAECVAPLKGCYGEDHTDLYYKGWCFGQFYIYNNPLREERRACFPMKCPDPATCLGQLSLNEPLWVAGVPPQK